MANAKLKQEINERRKLMKIAGLLKEEVFVFGQDAEYIVRINDIDSYEEFQQRVDNLRSVNPEFNDMVHHFTHNDDGSDGVWGGDASDYVPIDDEGYEDVEEEFSFNHWIDFELSSYDPADYENDTIRYNVSPNDLSPEFKRAFRSFITDTLRHVNALADQGDFGEIGPRDGENDNVNPATSLLDYMNNLSEDQPDYFPDEEDEALFQEIWDEIIVKAEEDDADRLITMDDLNTYFQEVIQTYQ